MSAIRKSSMLTAVILGMFVSPAHAQEIVTVKVPFPFVVGHKEFPAGQYDIRKLETTGSVVSIEGVNNTAAAFALTIPAGGGDPVGNDPALVFLRYENKYRLSEIWESREEGRALPGISAAGKSARAETQDEPSDVRTYVLAANWK